VTRDQKYMGRICELGCIVCRIDKGVFSPAEPHHLLKNGRRIDDLHTIPLCPLHHRAGVNNDEFVSRHPWKTEFESRYGSEWKLFALTKEALRVA
jgi:hypothetical protein